MASSTLNKINSAGGILNLNNTSSQNIEINLGGGTTIFHNDLTIQDNLYIGQTGKNGENFLLIENDNSGINAFTSSRWINDSGSGAVFFLNSSTRTNDGGINTGTLRNDVGSLRLQSSGEKGINIAFTTGIVSLDNTTASLSSSTGSLLLPGGLSISNTTDASSANNGGSFTTAGGLAVEKSAFIGTTLSINTSTKITQANIYYTGNNDSSITPYYNFGARIHNTIISGVNNRSNLILFTDNNSTQGAIGGYRNNFNADFRGGLMFLVGSQPGGYTQNTPSTITEASNSLTEAMRITPQGVLNVNGTTASTSSNTGIITTSGGIGISNSTNAVSSTNGGSLTIAGGAAIDQSLFVGTAINLNSLTASQAVFTDGSKNLISRDISDNIFVSVKDYGAVGDGVTDDTAAFQAAINAAAPYVWQGSVSATNNSQQVVSRLFVPRGNYRITAPLLLAKGLHMFGEIGSGFFQTTNQSTITADFNNMAAYILDTAPFITGGTRPLAAVYTGAQFDAGQVSTTNSIVLEHLLIQVAAGKTVLGGLNMVVSAQSHVKNCGFVGMSVGIRATASWGGSFRDNHIYTKAQGIYCNNDITVWDIQNNYITVTNNPDVGYIFPGGETNIFSGGTVINGNYACILLKFSSPIIKNNTLEGGNIGIAAESCYALNLYANYMEVLQQWCYALNTNNANIISGYTFCSAAKILWATGSPSNKITLDFSAVSSPTILQDSFTVSFIDKITVKVPKSYNWLYNSRVDFITPENEIGTNIIYLSSSGNDTYNGINSSNAVLTLQEAFLRIKPGMTNNIIIPASQTVSSKYLVGAITATNYIIPHTTLNIYSLGSGGTRGTINITQTAQEIHSIQMEGGNLNLTNVIFNIAESTLPNYRAFIRTKGILNIEADSCDFIGAGVNAALFGGRWQLPSTMYINTRFCAFNTLQFIKEATDSGGTGTVTWTENNSDSTFTNVTTDTSYKIFSKQFPGVTLNGDLNTEGEVYIRTDQALNAFNVFDLIDSDIISQSIFIAHRFSPCTQPIYSLKNIIEQIKLGARHIEFDISQTTDGIFFISHGGTFEEEYETADRTVPLTEESLKTAVVKRGIPLLNYGEKLPTLEEAWDVLKEYDICIWFELKSGTDADLYNELQRLGITKERGVISDFSISTVEYFYDRGYRTAFATNAAGYNALTGVQQAKVTYIVCSIAEAVDVDVLGKSFITYTHVDARVFNILQAAYTNIVGCYTDAILVELLKDVKNPTNTNLLDPRNYRVSYHLGSGSNSFYDPSTFLTFKNGKPRKTLTFASNIQQTSIHTFYHYQLPEQFYFKYEYDDGNNTGSTLWFGFLVRFDEDYLELDAAGYRYKAINIFHRKNGLIELFQLSGGIATQLGSPPTKQIIGKGPQYASFKRVISGPNATFYFKVSSKPEDVIDPTISPDRTFTSSTAHYLEPMRLSYKTSSSGTDTISGFFEYSETAYTNEVIKFEHDTTATTSSITGALTLTGGIATSNTTDATSSTSGGSITAAGGLAIAKKAFIGTTLSINTTIADSPLVIVGSRNFQPTAQGIYCGATGSTSYGFDLVSSSNSGSLIDFGEPNVNFNGRIYYDNTGDYFDISTGGGIVSLSISTTTVSSSRLVSFSNTTASTNNTTAAVVLAGGISISLGQNSSSYTNGGTITSAGGASFVGDIYTQGILYNGGFNFILGQFDQVTRGNSNSSRALVKDTGPGSTSYLKINFQNDFSAGTIVESTLQVNGLIYTESSTDNIAISMNASSTQTGNMSAYIRAVACQSFTASSAGTPTGIASITYTPGVGYSITGSAQFDFWRTYINIPTGTYTFRLVANSLPDSGIVDIKVNNVSIGTIDLYNASIGNLMIYTITSVSVGTSGIKKIELQLNTKNASSSGYGMVWEDAAFVRTS